MTARLCLMTCAYFGLGVLAWAADFWWPWLVVQSGMAVLILVLVGQTAIRLLRFVKPKSEVQHG